MAARGDEDGLNEEIVPYGFVNANEELAHGIRMLHIAAYYGHEGVVKLLVRRGATDSRAGAHPYRFWTVLHFAVASGNLECLRALKPTFEKLQRRDTVNMSCIHIASHNGHNKVIQEMIDLAPSRHAALKMLNEEGRNAGGDSFGDSPLDEACSGKQWGTMKFLVAKGATFVHSDRLGKQLLAAAPQSDQAEGDPKQKATAAKMTREVTDDDEESAPPTKRTRPSDEGVRDRDDDDDENVLQKDTSRKTTESTTSNPLIGWEKKFERLASIAIASGVDRNKIDLIRFGSYSQA